jgi:hypothetical protein
MQNPTTEVVLLEGVGGEMKIVLAKEVIQSLTIV